MTSARALAPGRARRQLASSLMTIARRAAPFRADLAGLALTAVLVAALRASGFTVAARDTFIFMGFDTERGVLLTGLLVAAAATAVTAAFTARSWSWMLASLGGLAAVFGGTFIRETSRAMTSSASLGRFDPLGWTATVVALVGAAALVGLGIGAMTRAARGALADVGRGVAAARTQRRWRALPARRLGAAAALLAVTVVAVPVLGQMVNFSPDSLMLQGAPAGVPLVGSGPGMGGLPSPPPLVSSVATPGRTHVPAKATASPAGQPSSGAVARPWFGSRPSGSGSVVLAALPAPWVGGRSSTAQVWIYLPPGYQQQAARRYPVIYEIPWRMPMYDAGANIQAILNAQITSGAIPPSIVVFSTSDGGPYIDNECINSADGREWYDTFVATTLVRYVDSHYRSIAQPRARTLLGDSQGGFCAANLLMRHPDVFGAEISFSGYYLAAPLLGVSPSAQAPYGGNRALMRANSPMYVAPGVAPALRAQLLVVLVGNPQQPFYGDQLRAYSAELTRLGVPQRVIVTAYGHSWNGVRATLADALLAVAEHQVQLGLLGT